MKTRGLSAVFAMLVAPGAWSADTTSDSTERQRISVERREAEAEFNRRNQACQLRFVVTSCTEAARKDHRDAMERLRLQQSMLDESQRKQRAARRIDEIRAKVSAEEASRRDNGAQERRVPTPRPAAVPAAAASAASADAAPATRPPRSSRQTTARPPARDRSSTEARRLAEHQARQVAAQAHREAVLRRNAERASSGKRPAAALPVPGPASASAP